MDLIRTAIVGYGLAGKVFHAPLIAATPSMKVTAIVTSDPDRRASAIADFPEAKIFGSTDDIFNRAEEFDLVVLATPNKFHAPQATQAMTAGLSVVIDKPMATTSADCEALIELQKSTGLMLTVFHNRRWDNDFLTIEKILWERKLKQVARFESRFERFRPLVDPQKWRESSTESGGGLLFDLQSHLIDQACHLFGTPTHVYAEVRTRRIGATADDDTFVALTFDSGVEAHLWTNVISAINAPRFRLLTVNGSFEKYGLDPQEDALRAGSGPGSASWGVEDEKFSGQLAIVDPDNSLVVSSTVPSITGCYEQFYLKVADAMRTGAPPPVDPADGLRVIKIIEHAKISSDTKSVCKLD